MELVLVGVPLVGAGVPAPGPVGKGEEGAALPLADIRDLFLL